MTTTTYIIIGLLIFLILYGIVIYNKLIKNQNLVKEGWSGIEVQLKQRANLIPNLLETVKGYMTHERKVMEEVTEMRAKCLNTKDVNERAKNEGILTAALSRLFAVAENYPDLKASQNFIDLQNSLEEIENQIQMSRRYYNGTVRDFNILIESFPSNIVAKLFKFLQAQFFELENPDDRKVPEVSF